MGAGHRGFRLGLRFWPGAAVGHLALLHATGFSKEMWDPVVEELRTRGCEVEAIGWDQRGHGESDPVDLPVDWWDLGKDAAAVLSGLDRPVMGVGLSSGAAALMMAAVLKPDAIDRLVAIEPIIFPPPYRVADNPLSELALKRRPAFSSWEVAEANFASTFPEWDPRSLEAYLRGVFDESEAGLQLRCPPETEADYYRHGQAHGMWDRLPEVSIPVLLVAGDRSPSHPPDLVMAMAAELPNCEVAFVEGAGHLVPMERPQETAALIDRWWRASKA